MSSNSLSFPSATALLPAIPTLKPGTPVFDVLSGPHVGVSSPIDNADCTIGSSLGCDLVLSDANIAQEHLKLRFYGREAAIDAVGGDVFIEGRPMLSRGHGCRVKLPAILLVGDTKLRIRRHASAGFMTSRWTSYAIVAVVIAMLPVVAGQSNIVQSSIAGRLSEVAMAPEDLLTVGSIPIEAASPTDGEIVGTLQQKMAVANLGNLALSADGRHIHVSGQVPADRMDAWRDLQHWFDRSHGGRYVLTSFVSAAAVSGAPKFTFQAVFFGKNPYVIDARGERRYPGASLQDGWILKSIEEGQILVVRGGEEFKLTL
ncbi:hypothetical protein ELG83_24270 (plasmid) [Rhizobium leguminosarum]|uniref:SctD/MshK family protein n=1 Tax=Rhizobium TaxID=379 RepID=UPI001031C5B7|nr:MULTISPECIES: FHA domain-containing protein [Rhizobium]MBY5378383.1 hypothetical protein [Rhizobium leguminosarum]TBF35130.1 hypothetical protein ELG88_07820 [Rhizobium leguminosarum]TBF87970.1 hypothetical protein ELG83_24270 [Rhizobium leguminosarum]WSH48671.1 FHA domain-containing protein [Rhizobium johnstonii]